MNVWWKVVEYDDYRGKDGPGTWGNGVLSVSLERWDGFYAVVARLLDLGDFVWRGQRQDWLLKSRFQREVTDNRVMTLERHTRAFERAIKGRRGTNPPSLNDGFALWSLGQHYGLPTPLLDWTESPFVAAYFACYEEPVEGQQPYRYVYGLSWDITRWGPSTSPEIPPAAPYIAFEDTPSDENARLLSQKGLFTVPLTADIEIEERVQACYASEDEKRKNRQRVILVRIEIPETDRVWCLRDLNRMNINHATLFPDLTGAAMYCAMKLKIKDY
jgi:hypothetical protein